jgi:hypothetical protein
MLKGTMIENIDVEDWLRARSRSVVQNGNELVFTHTTGAKSVLVHRGNETGLISVENGTLNEFYNKYTCASIGDSMLMLGATIRGGVELSLGYRIRDLLETRALAAELSVAVAQDDLVFMIGSLGEFFYAYSNSNPQPQLRCYDREFNEVREDQTFGQVLDDWWQISLENPRNKNL